MIVLDASAAIELVLHTPTGARVASRLGSTETMHAPHLIDLEVASVLRRREATNQLTAAEAVAALRDYLALELERYPHELLLPRIWQLRGNLTTYDACYVALAEALRAPLLTCDGPLSKAPGHRARIELV